MRMGILILLAMLSAGCTVPPAHQKGGAATATIPEMGPAPATTIAMRQPENPDGASDIGYRERRELTRPDGSVETYEREVGTQVGGSQDLAQIIAEVMRAEFFRGLLLAAGLGVCAVVAASRGWPLMGGVLGAGALASAVVAWWAGLVAVVGGVLIYTAYQVALAHAKI